MEPRNYRRNKMKKEVLAEANRLQGEMQLIFNGLDKLDEMGRYLSLTPDSKVDITCGGKWCTLSNIGDAKEILRFIETHLRTRFDALKKKLEDL